MILLEDEYGFATTILFKNSCSKCRNNSSADVSSTVINQIDDIVSVLIDKLEICRKDQYFRKKQRSIRVS